MELLNPILPYGEVILREEQLFINNLTSVLGFPEDQLRTVLCMLAAYPLSFLLKFLPSSPSLKHIYNVSLGIFFCVYTLGRWSWLHLFGSSLISYLILLLVSPKFSHKLVFVWAMGYITVSHIYRLYTDYMGWTLDFTGPQMLLTLKLTSMGWNYYDGVANKNATDKQKAASISKLPSLLEFYGWVFFFPSLLAGPAIEIKDYLSYINKSMFKSYPANKNRTPDNYVIPSTFLPTLLVLGRGIIVAAGLVVGSMFFPTSRLLSTEFAETPFFQRLVLLHIIILFVRYKYYFAWIIGEGACVAAGLGYNGLDKNGKAIWDKCCNVHVLKIELAQNIRDMSTYWNIGTAVWLRKYIYDRVQSKNSLVPLLATYVTSAFWHGFYPGYYLFFVSGGVLTEIAREARRRLRPKFVITKEDKTEVNLQPWKFLYDVFGIICTELALSYIGVAFVLLSWENSLKAWTILGFSGHFALVAVFILLKLVPPPRKSAPAKKAE